MKRFLLFAGIIAILFSCVGFPEPEGEANSLVIGNFILDFPDGFFQRTPRTFKHGVTLKFRNTTKNTNFSIKTSDGYFYFLTNGTDEYLFESFTFSKQYEDHEYSLGETPIGKKVSTRTGKVIYLGHITFTYSNPEITKRESKGRGKVTYYDYEKSISTKMDRNALIQYMKDIQQDSPWLVYEIVEYDK